MEQPILFSTPMIQAILDGRKSQTRRICKPQPYPDLDDRLDPIAKGILLDTLRTVRYKKGMILWVRETWRPKGHNFPIGFPYEWKATAEEDGVPINEPWKPSIFMPKVACRIKLEITDIRIEMLQDISEEDAIAEGIERVDGGFKSYEIIHGGRHKGEANPHSFIPNKAAVTSYRELWESINGFRSWDLNPWVWVIEFKNLHI